MTCDDAKRAIETRNFVGWTGLPATCTATGMFGVPADVEFGVRKLGKARAGQWGLDLPGYPDSLVSVRDGVVVLFDGINPDLEGGWSTLAADLGEPEAKLDYEAGLTVTEQGEWIYAARGITVFLGSKPGFVAHIAVYAPTTVADYLARLQPHLGRKRRPLRR